MKLLIIGGTHFIGKAISRRAIESGYDVVHFNRGMTDPNCPTPTIRGDIDEILNYKSELLSLKVDAVIHCIAYTEKHAADCVELFKNSGSRIVALGSQDCYEAFQAVNRGKEVSDFPISESDATSSIRYYWRGIAPHSGGENYDKNLMTDVLMNATRDKIMEATVLRLPMVYGPGDHNYRGRHGAILRRIFDKQKALVLGQLDQTQICTYGYIDNIAAGVLHTLSNADTIGKIYNLGETKVRTRRRWAELYARAANWSFDFTIVPDELIEKDSKYRDYPPQHLIFDCRLFLTETGFKAPISFDDALEHTMKWALNHPEVLGPKPDYEAERRMVERYAERMNEIIG